METWGRRGAGSLPVLVFAVGNTSEVVGLNEVNHGVAFMIELHFSSNLCYNLGIYRH